MVESLAELHGLSRVWKWLREEISLATNHCLLKKPSVIKYLYVWRHLTRAGFGDGVLPAGSLSCCRWTQASHFSAPEPFSGWLAAVLVCILFWFPWMNCPIPRHSKELSRAWCNWWQKIQQTEDTPCKCTECDRVFFTTASKQVDCCWSCAGLRTVVTAAHRTEPRKVPLTRWVSRGPHRGQACAAHAETASPWQWQGKRNSWDRRSKPRRSYGQGWGINKR